ncbi:MAG: hypothetical protein SGI77_19245 [Pirellulaceae bacterium]|nr:hypothetical protein [Pirellulaceae bacterium]
MIALIVGLGAVSIAADTGPKYARADTDGHYVHWIELYDANSTKINPADANPRPYSSRKTCGRCHDFEKIVHGWHFDAVEQLKSESGRPGQPWVWNDPRTGTILPLSYRGWTGTYNPDAVGISRWSVTKQFGGFLPGGGPGSFATSKSDEASPAEMDKTLASSLSKSPDRETITGSLPVDCMLCHRSGGEYNPEIWSKQIEAENFEYAPTVASGLAVIEGSLSRVRENASETDPDDLPKLTYDMNRFRPDGKVFFDIVRKPHNASCNHCHTNLAAQAIDTQRWAHDDDIHMRAGMSCVDCHRNGLDHEMVRGYPGQNHPQPKLIATLSCQGCHLGGSLNSHDANLAMSDNAWRSMGGRMGAPKPLHRGLPPLHFEKLTCTACHSGPLADMTPVRQLTSQLHHLGVHEQRTGNEAPAIVAPIMLPIRTIASHEDSDKPQALYTPHRMMWPAFWGVMHDGRIDPLEPESVYQLTRKTLKVKKDLSEEIGEVKPALSDRKRILGDDRYKVKEEEWTPAEVDAIDSWIEEQSRFQVDTRIAESLDELQKVLPEGKQAVYVTGGKAYRRSVGEDKKLEIASSAEAGKAIEPTVWPLGHNVRPARMALGASGCVECHSDGSPFFATRIDAVSFLPGKENVSVMAHELQQADMNRLKQWNSLFASRAAFKYFAFGCLGLTTLVVLSGLTNAIGNRLGANRRRSS